MPDDAPQKPIRLSKHAMGYVERRGFTVDQVLAAIRTCEWKYVGDGRFEASKDFAFEALWNGIHYDIKTVRPIFTENDREILVITVYTYYH